MKCFSAEEKDEIRTMFRDAARPKKQIVILSHLYACAPQDIQRVLGLPIDNARGKPKNKRKTTSQMRWTHEMEERLIALYRHTHSTADIADALGLPPGKVRGKICKLRKSGRIARSAPPALSACAEGGGEA